MGPIVFAGQRFSRGDSYGLADCELRAGCFSQDSRGRWYFNVVAKVKTQARAGAASVGIALGLRQAAVASSAIFVGDVASARLVKTKMAKGTPDAGLVMLRALAECKSPQAGIVFEVVNESHATQTCSCCGSIPASSPKGAAGQVEQVCKYENGFAALAPFTTEM